MKAKVLIAFLLALFLAGKLVKAEVQTGVSALLGFGGKVEIDGKHDPGELNLGGDFVTSIGAGICVHFGILDALFIGGEARILWWSTEWASERDISRSMIVEVGPSLRLGFEVISNLSLFIRLAPGFTIVIPSEKYSELWAITPDDVVGELKTGFGFNVGGFAGASYYILDTFGVMFEFGYIHHQAYGDWNAFDFQDDYAFSGGQFHLHIGAYF